MAVCAPEDTYLAGLWRRDIFRGLLWMSYGGVDTIRSSGYRAPSWSWAALTGQIKWPSRTIARHCRDDFTVDVLDARTTPAGEDQLGAVSCGFIRMLGKIKKLTKVAEPLEGTILLRFPLNLIYENEVIGSGAFDVVGDSAEESVWLMQIQSQLSGDSNIPYHPTGLILRKLGGPIFQRMGCATLDEGYIDFFDCCEPRELTLI